MQSARGKITARRPQAGTVIGAVLVGVVGLTAGCANGAAAPPGPLSTPALSTPAGTARTITAGELLAATGGRTPVAYADPALGRLARGPGGSLVYTPDAGYTGPDPLSVTTSDAVRAYATDIPPIATVGGVPIEGSAYGSALVAVPGRPGEYYGLTDRGPNVDGPADDQKVLPVPDFHPQIGTLRLVDGTAVLEGTIVLSGTDGQPLNGLVDPRATTGENLVDLAGAPLPTSDHGLDPEGLVALADGTFWVSDEYGPFLVHFDAAGREIERLSPFAGTLPRELARRTPNQGMEGLTVTPDGSTLVGVMQSALKAPGLVGDAKSVPLTRIVTVTPATGAVREYLYPLANPQRSKVAVSEITALDATRFLVDERDGKLEPGADKKIYVADITGATDVGPQATVPGARYQADAGGLLVGGKALETLVGVTTPEAATATLRAAGITVAGKTAKLDLGGLVTGLAPDGSFFGHDKVEGLSTPDGGTTLVISNDSDFGIAGVTNDRPPFTLKAKTLPDGRPDTGEILVVDTTRLPARTTPVTITVTVG